MFDVAKHRHVNPKLTINDALFHLVFRLDVFSLEFLEAFDWNVCDQCVELVGRVFVVVAATRQANADTERWISKMEYFDYCTIQRWDNM